MMTLSHVGVRAQARLEVVAARFAKERVLRVLRQTARLGGKLGPMRASSLGVYQITPRNSTEVSDYGIDDVSSRLKDVEAVVDVTFRVER